MRRNISFPAIELVVDIYFKVIYQEPLSFNVSAIQNNIFDKLYFFDSESYLWKVIDYKQLEKINFFSKIRNKQIKTYLKYGEPIENSFRYAKKLILDVIEHQKTYLYDQGHDSVQLNKNIQDSENPLQLINIVKPIKFEPHF